MIANFVQNIRQFILRGLASKVHNRGDKLPIADQSHMAKTCISEAYKQIMIASGNESSEVNSALPSSPGRGTKA